MLSHGQDRPGPPSHGRIALTVLRATGEIALTVLRATGEIALTVLWVTGRGRLFRTGRGAAVRGHGAAVQNDLRYVPTRKALR